MARRKARGQQTGGNAGVFLHEEAWRKSFEGFSITDVAVRDRYIVYLVLRQELPKEQEGKLFDHDIRTRFAGLYLNDKKPGESWFHQGLDGFRRPKCGVSREPLAQGLIASANGDVHAHGSGQKEMEQVVADGQPTSIERLRTIGGRAYGVGLFREVYRRDGIGAWELLGEGLPELSPGEMQPERMFDSGFRDIDGFAEDDLYAVGGKGKCGTTTAKRGRS